MCECVGGSGIRSKRCDTDTGSDRQFKYLIIAIGDDNVGNALELSDSEIGATSRTEPDGNNLGFSDSVYLPVPIGAGPSGDGLFDRGEFDVTAKNQFGDDMTVTLNEGVRNATTGIITLDGDAALTSGDEKRLTSSNSDVHAANKGPGSPGAQGIDCQRSFNSCTDNGSQFSNDRLNTTGLPGGPSFSNTGNNNGAQGGVDHTGILSEMTTFRDNVASYDTDGTIEVIDLGTGLNNENFIFDFGSGINIVDLDTNGDLGVTNSNWIVNGNADTSVVFLLDSGAVLDVSQSVFSLSGDIGLNNVLFLADGDEGVQSISFDNVEFWGFAFWDLFEGSAGGDKNKNVASYQNTRGCGQTVSDQVQFSNVSWVGCNYGPTTSSTPPPVPVPASLPLILGGFGLLGGLSLRRKQKAA